MIEVIFQFLAIIPFVFGAFLILWWGHENDDVLLVAGIALMLIGTIISIWSFSALAQFTDAVCFSHGFYKATSHKTEVVDISEITCQKFENGLLIEKTFKNFMGRWIEVKT